MSVLAATDLSETSLEAVRFGGREARLRGEELVVVHVLQTEANGGLGTSLFDVEEAAPERLRSHARSRLIETVGDHLTGYRPPATISYRVRLGDPIEVIHEMASEPDCSLLVIGATGRSRLRNLLLGSTADELIRSTPTPVLTIPGETEVAPFESILVPVDFSECSRSGLEIAADLARRDGSRVTVVHEGVLRSFGSGRPRFGPRNGVGESYRREAIEKLDNLMAEFDFSGIECKRIVDVRTFESRTTADAIVRQARKSSADLIVMGTHGRTGFRRFLLGSTTMNVLRQMPCPVLTMCSAADR
mgnify:CR=1 FL=1